LITKESKIFYRGGHYDPLGLARVKKWYFAILGGLVGVQKRNRGYLIFFGKKHFEFFSEKNILKKFHPLGGSKYDANKK